MISNKKKLLSGIGVDAIGTAIAMIVGVVAIPFMFLYISKDEFGVWLAVNGLVSLVSVADIGTDQYLMTVISNENYFKSRKFGNYILSTFILKFFIALLIISIGYFVYKYLPVLLVMTPDIISAARNSFLIAIITLIFLLFGNTFNTVLYGRKHFSLVAAVSAISAIAISILTVVLLRNGLGIESFPLAIMLITILQYTFLIYMVYKKYPHINFRLRGFEFKNKREMISYSASFQILRWANIFKSQYLVVAINNFIGPSAGAVYNLTARLPQLNMLFCSKISSPFFPFIAQYVSGENQMNIASRAFVKLTRVVLRFSIFFAILTFVLTKSFVLLWVGENNFAGNEILFMICLASFLSSSLASFSYVVFATKKFENWVFFSIFEIIFAIVICYALSEHYGFLGVVSGFALASTITFVYLVIIVLRQLNMNLLAFFTNTIRYALLANISTILLAIIAIKYFYISTWTDFFIVCCIFGIIHLIFTEGLMIITSKEIGFREKVIKVIRDELTL